MEFRRPFSPLATTLGRFINLCSNYAPVEKRGAPDGMLSDDVEIAMMVASRWLEMAQNRRWFGSRCHALEIGDRFRSSAAAKQCVDQPAAIQPGAASS